MANEITYKLSIDYTPADSDQLGIDKQLSSTLDQAGNDSASGTISTSTSAASLDIPSSYAGTGTIIAFNLDDSINITISDQSDMTGAVTVKPLDFVKCGFGSTIYAKSASGTPRLQWWYIEA